MQVRDAHAAINGQFQTIKMNSSGLDVIADDGKVGRVQLGDGGREGVGRAVGLERLRSGLDRLALDLPEDAVMIHQERAYTSPVWYTP